MLISDADRCICNHQRWTHWYKNSAFVKCIESACFCPGFKLDNIKFLEQKYLEKKRV